MIRALLAGSGVTLVIAGCALGLPGPAASTARPTESAPPAAERIVVLAGTVGVMVLVAPEPTGGLTAVAGGGPAGLPANAAWLSSDSSELLATTLDGRALTGSFGVSGSSGSTIAWAVPPGDLSGPHPQRAFGSLGPEGYVAFVEGDPGAGKPGRLVVDSATGAVLRVVALPTAAEGPPAWLPNGRIAVVVRNLEDEPECLLVDADGRPTLLNGPPNRSVAVGGGLAAVVDQAGDLHVGIVATWLAGSGLEAVQVGGQGDTVIQAQPSPSGTELAVVVADPDGDASSIRLLVSAGGWHEIARFELPAGANRAVVGWLAAP